MMEMAKVTSKGQITIPISIRRRLGINEGDKILFINKLDGVMMVNPDTVSGDIADYTADSVPLDTTVASAPSRAAAAAPVSSPAAPPAAEPKTAAAEPAAKPEAALPPEPAPPRRKYIPPVVEDEPDVKPSVKAGGIDLSTLLDDIRSIGSNI